jgi:N-acylneuraminate cytidylyltransferase/CMP-N,N'-diacetyllegionaminic acid synthase
MKNNRLCTICARGGSKGVPGKNIRPLLGKPLIAHSIEQARACGLFSYIAVSSDSAEILEIAKAYGADLAITRPAAMATCEAAKIPAIAHAVRSAETMTQQDFAIVVDLAATSPLRRPDDIIQAVKLLVKHDAASIITGTASKCSPYFSLVEKQTDGTVRLSKQASNAIVRRQDTPACFDMNGSIYVWNKKRFLDDPNVFYDDTRLYEMPRERSVDIDDELDFILAEWLLKQSVGGKDGDI